MWIARVTGVAALLLLLAGCGARPKATARKAELPPTPSLEFQQSVIRTADPDGKWKFEARSARVAAATTDGPFTLTPADGVYQETGKAPVRMRARQANIDKKAGRLVLTGDVRISSDGWTLDADRVSYDLKTGKVVAPGRTKLTLTQPPPTTRSGRGHDTGARR